MSQEVCLETYSVGSPLAILAFPQQTSIFNPTLRKSWRQALKRFRAIILCGLKDVADDLDDLGDVAFWFRMIGFIMTFVTIAIILLKATYYTVENLPWKPGAVGLTMRFVEAARVIAAYVILMTAVFLQAYLTDKSCQVNINNTVIETPMCEVVGEQCEFVCVTYQQNFSSPCTECDIKYAWW